MSKTGGGFWRVKNEWGCSWFSCCCCFCDLFCVWLTDSWRPWLVTTWVVRTVGLFPVLAEWHGWTDQAEGLTRHGFSLGGGEAGT
jgi:hypothetical protein